MNDMGEFGKTIEIVLGSDKVQEEIEKLQLPKGTVILPEPWIYGMILPHTMFSLK